MIGTDILQNKRIKNIINNSILVKRILSKRELEIFDTCFSEKEKIEFLAGRFSAKESIIKASNKKLLFSKIEILKSNSGKPIVYYNFIYRKDIQISISHENDYTISFSLILDL